MKQQSGTSGERRTRNYLTLWGRIWCYSSDTAGCYFMPDGLASLKKAIPAHDEELMEATEKINAILRRVMKNNSQKDVELHLLDTPRGFLLAWASDGVSGLDDDKVVTDALGLK